MTSYKILPLLVTSALTLSLTNLAQAETTGIQFASQTDKNAFDRATMLNSQAFKRFKQGDVTGAIDSAKESLAIRTRLLGDEHQYTAVSAGTLGYIYSKTGEYELALPLLTLSNRISEQKLGLSDPYTGISINNLARLYQSSGRYQEALPLFERAITIYQAIYGEEHKETASVYRNYAGIYENLGRYKASIPLFKKALAIRTKVLGAEHKDTIISHQNIAHAYQNIGDYDQAIFHFKKTIALDQKVHGKQSANLAYGYNDLANVYMELGDYNQALALAHKGLAIREHTLGKRHYLTAISYNTTAMIYKKLSKYEQAIDLMTKALAIVQAKKGADHDSTADLKSNLAGFYKDKGDFQRALTLYNEALAIRQQKFGNNHPKVGESFNALAIMYSKMNDFEQAKDYYERSIAIDESVYGLAHSATASSYSNYAGMFEKVGDYDNALTYYNKALAIREKIHGDNNIRTAITYNNLAQLYAAMDNTQLGLPLAQKSAKIIKKTLGASHEYTAVSYSTLGAFYTDLAQYDDALAVYEQAKEFVENKFGTNHIMTAGIYINLASVNIKQKRFTTAKQQLEKALAIYRSKFGHNHGAVSKISQQYSKLLIKEFSELLPAYHNALLSFEGFKDTRDNVFATFDQKIKKNYLDSQSQFAPWLAYTAYKLIDKQTKQGQLSPTGEQQNINPKITSYSNHGIKQTTFSAWLNSKGALYDAENMLAMMTSNSNDPEILAITAELNQQKIRMGKLHQRIAKGTKKTTATEQEINSITQNISRLESKLASKTERYSVELGLKNIDVADIANSLTDEQLYIDFMATKMGQMFIFSVDSQQNISFKRISDINKLNTLVTAIQNNITDYQQAQANGSADRRMKASFSEKQTHQYKALYQLIFKENPELLSKPELVISPDGALRLLPFEALINDQGNYLIANKRIRYVPSGKEWLRLKRQQASATKTDLTLLYNPNYRANITDSRSFSSIDITGKTRTPNTDISKQIKLIDMAFGNLSGTRVEGKGILKLAQKYQQQHINDYEKEQANKDNLLATTSSKYLHIASHGFFINDDSLKNPMLKSGLALAGAKQGSFTGKVTALELTGMNLQGTDTVILSACETGKVTINDTESVSGLTKAFIQAGAKNVVMSLWSVPDKETAELMQDYYEGVYATQANKAEALRQAKLKLIKNNKQPLHWAGFVLSGGG